MRSKTYQFQWIFNHRNAALLLLFNIISPWSDAVHSIRPLYQLLSSHRDRRIQIFKMEYFAKKIMPECRCATIKFSEEGEGGLCNHGTLIKISSETPEKEAL